MALTGKIAVVTGAGRGIGQGIACGLAKEGAFVICIDLVQDRIDETLALIVADGGTGAGIKADISQRAIVHDLIEGIVAGHGGLDIVVNNAAWIRYQPLADVDDTVLDRMLTVGVKSMIWMAQAAAPHLAGRDGAIVNICSTVMVRATPDSAAYAAVKGAVAALTRQLAVDLGPQGTRVNAVAPGFIETEAAVRNIGADGIARRLAVTPLGRSGRPQDIADAVAFLASDKSRYITGEVILVDGGRANASL